MRTDQLATAFRELHALLDGLDWWLTDGAALGAVRDGRIIGGDIDIGVWAGHLDAAAAALAGKHMRRHRWEVKANVGGVKVDVHGHRRSDGMVWYPLGASESVAYEFPAQLFGEFEQVELYRLPAWVPYPVEDYLVAHYGPGWRTPRPGWRWAQDPPCLRRSKPA